MTVWAVIALAAAALYVYLHGAPLQPGAPAPGQGALHRWASVPAQVLFLLTVTSPLPFLLAAFSGLRHEATKNFWIRVALLAALPWVAFVGARRSAWPLTEAALVRAANQARPLIVAIERHRIARGTPPRGLEELSMKIPGTSVRGYPTFTYVRRSFAEAKAEAWWYDLGPRAGRSQTNRWRSADGKLSHAVLVVRINGVGAVTEMFADRMPIRGLDTEFTRDAWQNEPTKRLSLARDLIANHSPADRSALIALLGEPDGKRVEVDAPWELRMPSSPSELGDDPARMNFFYWPTRSYPDHIDGLPVRRIGDWAYLLR
ncbi:MAG: hypothetical protein AAF654_01010 [Myxococcota bacterium]